MSVCTSVCLPIAIYHCHFVIHRSYAGSTTIQVDDVATVKILVLGDKGVGKTSLILKYAKNDFDIHKSPTVSIRLFTKMINFPFTGDSRCNFKCHQC